MSIAERVFSCVQSFKTCLESFRKQRSQDLDHNIPHLIKEEFGRFKIWSSNIGAHQLGPSSLDHRLRDAPSLRKRVTELITNINKEIEEANAIITGEKIPWDAMMYDSDSFREKDDDDDPQIAEIIEETLAGSTKLMAPTELAQICCDLSGMITALFRLSLAMRKPGLRSRFLKVGSVDTSSYHSFDVGHVESKFPGADTFLHARLGKANSQRRLVLKQTKEHHEKFAQGLLSDHQETATVASSLPSEIKKAALSDIDSLMIDVDKLSDTGVSHTSYADSRADSVTLRVPRLPQEKMDGKEFECQYCYSIIRIFNRRQWKKHVYTDISPYICLSSDCKEAEITFSNRHDWAAHLRSHQTQWICTIGCDKHFQTSGELRNHITRFHRDKVDIQQLDIFVSACERSLSKIAGGQCPLCHQHLNSQKQVEKHVGQHLEELALFTLPDHLEQETDDEKEISSSGEIGPQSNESEDDDDEDLPMGDAPRADSPGLDDRQLPLERNDGTEIANAEVQAKEVQRIWVPEKAVGIINSFSDEQIRNLHGCRIDIGDVEQSFGGRRPINLVGNLHAIALARAWIENFVAVETVQTGIGKADEQSAVDEVDEELTAKRQSSTQPYDSYSQSPNPASQQSAEYSRTQEERNYRWFVNGEGIRRDVIQADIHRYLGRDALVKPGIDENGHSGYWIAAYRPLTAAMIQDLKSDSANFERQSSRGSYQESPVHASRLPYGGSVDPVSNYRHYSGYTNPSYAQPPGSDSIYAQAEPSRGYMQNTVAGQYQSHTQHHPQTAPAGTSSTGAPAGYYLASDGRYYPERTTEPEAPAPNLPQAASATADPATATAGYYLASDGRYYPETTTEPGAPGAPAPNLPQAASATADPTPAPAGYYLASDGRYYPNSTRE